MESRISLNDYHDYHESRDSLKEEDDQKNDDDEDYKKISFDLERWFLE